jgi:membrane-associated phospholipid phosphatase
MDRRIIIAFVLLLAVSIAFSYAAYKYAVLPFDQASYNELHEEPRPLFSILMQDVSSIGYSPIPTILTVIAIATFALRRQWLEAAFMLATASNALLTFVLKAIIHRARPFPLAENTTGFIQSVNQYSYPSGHVVFFVVFFGLFAYLAWLHFAGWVRIVTISICAILIVLVGPSRVFLGAHWASVVVGGYLIGTIWLFVLIFTYHWVKRRRSPDCISSTASTALFSLP